jgi:PAS domain S-box-containing protein
VSFLLLLTASILAAVILAALALASRIRGPIKARIEQQDAELTQESEQRFRLLVDGMKDSAIVILDPEGRVVSWNQGAERLLGFQAADIIGRYASALHLPGDVALGKPQRELQIAADEGRFEDESERVRKDGSRFWASVVITALRDEQGRLRGFGKVTRDVTARRKADKERKLFEDKLREANRLKSEFLANMSHELRTPLNAIIGFAQLMHAEKVGPITAAHREFLGDILSSSKHLLRLIDDVLDVANVESGKMEFRAEQVGLAEIAGEIREGLGELAASKHLRVDLRIDPEVNTAVVDPGRLKQILYNYLSNAIKFTPEGGRVDISIAPEGPELFRLDVEDTGIGISPEDLGKLFLEFQQLDAGTAKKYQGTGLGLALTKRIVEAQGGRVDVRSVPGRGSTFSAILPRARATRLAMAAVVAPP